MAKKYISNKDETPRLFGNDLMEKLSRVHPGVPLIIYGPAIAFFVYRGAVNETLSSFNMIGLFLLGTLFWTFMEYVIHRFAFHYMPKSELGKRFHFLIHGIHHDYPRDSKRLVMPPSVSIPLDGDNGANLRGTVFRRFCFWISLLRYDSLHAASFFHARQSTGPVVATTSQPASLWQ
jgi:hypothetical protein